MAKIFIDGNQGTTGLKLFSRLAQRADLEIVTLKDELRKDIAARKDCINDSDITFLCLPDAASVEAVGLIENPNVKIIDTSTAFRTADGWAYGFPELSAEFYSAIKNGKRVAVPGCHASGFLAIVYPLIKLGILKNDYPLVAYSLTGYSGGGKKMIAEYENEKTENMFSPRQYALTQEHKHLKEMRHIAGLSRAPIFSPIVDDYYSGMEVSVPLYAELVGLSGKQIHSALCDYYAGQKLVKVASYAGETEGIDKFIPSNLKTGKDDMLIFVGGNDERILLSAIFDNLGKGASGTAVECMNIMLGLEPEVGLIL